jgi:hypothetical protein
MPTSPLSRAYSSALSITDSSYRFLPQRSRSFFTVKMQRHHPPFPEEDQLITKLTDRTIPDGTAARLGDEFCCPVLEELYPFLDFVGVKSSLHIDPVHKHIQKGRKIVVTEDPSLHLIWHHGVVYVKPLPHYLLSYAFWKDYLSPGSAHRGEALGFVRSYERLIRHPSDFAFAQEARLIPASSPSSSGGEELTYTALITFLHHFSDIPDAEVSPRWHFGQLRLSRLNWAVRLVQPRAAREKGFQHRLFYGEQYWQTGQFLHEFAGPGLFAFAALSLILSAMQVVLAARSFAGEDGADASGRGRSSWHVFADVSTGFSIVVICILVASFFGLAVVMGSTWAWQIQFSYRSWRKSVAERRSLLDVETGSGEEVRVTTEGKGG